MNLITFCDNESLLSKKDKKILKEKNNFFVGDWCTQHDNMFSLKNQKKVLDLFKWGKTKERENNHNYVIKIYEEVLKNISINLLKAITHLVQEIQLDTLTVKSKTCKQINVFYFNQINYGTPKA